MNRADRRRLARERSQRHRLNTPAPFGGVAPRKQHGRCLMLVNTATGLVDRELPRDSYLTAEAACRHVWPDVDSFVTTIGVAEDYAIADWALGVPAQSAAEGGYGELVLVEGWCEHIRDAAAADLGIPAAELAESFTARPAGWLLLGHMPAGVLLGGPP